MLFAMMYTPGKRYDAPGSQSFTSNGNFTVPYYRTLTVRMWGGGGSGGSTFGTVSDGGDSTFNGMTAKGGESVPNSTVWGEPGGTQTGGGTGSSNGETGGNGESKTGRSGPTNVTSGFGGDSPEGGSGGAPRTSNTNASGNPGSIPGGAGSGSTAVNITVIPGGKSPDTYIYDHYARGGGGSGAYVIRTYQRDEAGAPTPGDTLPVVVGAAGLTSGTGGDGARGQVDISWT